MNPTSPIRDIGERHILIVDDNIQIHDDFRRILAPQDTGADFDADDAQFFGTSHEESPSHSFDLEFASQGQEALKKVQQAVIDNNRFSLVFMDVRMPPGWDGIETTRHLWDADPDLQIVICTAYADYSWEDMAEKLGRSDQWLILRKPFDVIEVEQVAHAFSKKWSLLQTSRRHAVFLEDTMDLSPLMIIWAESDGSICYANESTAKALHRAPRDIEGLTLADLFPDWSMKTISKLWKDAQKKHSINLECFISTAEPKPTAVEAIASILHFKDHNVLCITAQDITSRLKTLSELASARDSALKSSRIKSQFLANMSHEIRTPMNGVLGMAELLSKSNLTPTQQEYVSIINQSGSALLSIINDILDSAKIESGKISIKEEQFNLREFVRGIMQTISIQANEKNLKLWNHIDEEIPENLSGDPGRIRQVLLNLSDNAVKFTNQGEISLTVQLVAETANDCSILFTIKDTGMGIHTDHINTIFKPFAQIDSTNKRIHGGTGLGLTISSQIIQAMGSEINVESNTDHGATFSFTITLKRESVTQRDPELKPAETIQPAQNLPLSPTPPKTSCTTKPAILLAEDNLVNRKVTLLQLEQLGIVADVVENGQQAVEAVRDKPYDIILMDCQMPVMDGYEATRLIRSQTDREIRIIALTANAMREDRARCFNAGMDDYLSKPVNSNKLADAIGVTIAPTQPNPDQHLADPDHHGSQDPVIDEPVDFTRLREVTGDNDELLRDVCSQYLEQAENILDDIEAAVHAEQFETISKLAHKLAGSSATCGMISIVGPMRTLENNLADNILDALRHHSSARYELDRIRKALKSSPTKHDSQTLTPPSSDMSRILIADDDDFLTSIYSKTFCSAGYHIMTAGNGHEALNLLVNQQPDLVLLDLILPGIDGIEVLKFIRSRPNIAHLPVFILSNSTYFSGIAETARRHGATKFIRKGEYSPIGLVQEVSKTLPPAAVTISEPKSEPPPATPCNSSGPRTALIADDDRTIHSVLSYFLGLAGFKVESAFNGLQSLEMAHSNPPGVLILDVTMPIKDGFETLNEWILDPLLKDIPVIMLTGSLDEENGTKAIGQGATQFLTKPFTPDTLVKLAESLVS